MRIPLMFLRKTSVAETIFGGRGWEKESKDLTPPPPPPASFIYLAIVRMFSALFLFNDVIW